MRQPPERKDQAPPNARDSALRLLTRREHSARELKRKLAERGIDAPAATEAIKALASHGLQSDARYADQLVRTRIAQGYGPRRIKAELEQAGLSGEQTQEAMQAAECDWTELAQRVHAKRYGAAPTNVGEKLRQQRFLFGRGFDADQVRAAIRASAEDG